MSDEPDLPAVPEPVVVPAGTPLDESSLALPGEVLAHDAELPLLDPPPCRWVPAVAGASCEGVLCQLCGAFMSGMELHEALEAGTLRDRAGEHCRYGTDAAVSWKREQDGSAKAEVRAAIARACSVLGDG